MYILYEFYVLIGLNGLYSVILVFVMSVCCDEWDCDETDWYETNSVGVIFWTGGLGSLIRKLSPPLWTGGKIQSRGEDLCKIIRVGPSKKGNRVGRQQNMLQLQGT